MPMEAAVKIPLRDLTPASVRALQDRFPEGEMYIVPEAQPVSEARVMSEEKFWNLISLLDWNQTGNDDAVIEPVVRNLAAMQEAAIPAFYDLLSEKLFLLDGRSYAMHSIEVGSSISSDLFLYARCAVVANGRTLFESVLKKPESFPQNLYFEALLDIPHRAWLRKTGLHLDHTPCYIFETGFNPNGWGADTITL
jgi:hypothetical protein